MADEYIRKQDAFDAVEARITELMTHPEFCRKHLDIDLSGVIRNISAIKPADVVPVIYSHWTLVGWHKGMKVVECFKCKCRAIGSGNFCPNCGAKMVRSK